jgi:hypothetical protein
MLGRKRLRVLIGAVGACILAGPLSASAAIVGYWRYEDSPGFTADSSGSGRTLTLPGGTGDPTQVILPGSGAGSNFPSAIAGNAKAASFDGGDRFRVADEATFTDATFTVEALINGSDFATNGNQKSIIGQWNATGNQRSWLFAITGTAANAKLNFLYSTGGSDTVTVASGLPALASNTDYYVAMTVDMTDLSANGLTFYQKDLSTGVATSAGATHANTSFFNASSALTIGSTDQPSSQFTGLIDEVRYSDTKLPASSLLVEVPEPASVGLVMVGAMGLLMRRRRRA